MFLRGCVLELLLSVFFGNFIFAQDPTSLTQPSRSTSFGTLTGAVLSPDGHPLPGVRVELHDANASVVAKAETESSGWFALYDLPPGFYEVKSLAGGSEARQFVDLGAGRSTVEMRFIDASRPPVKVNSMISVAQMSVAGSARKFYEKARTSIGKRDYSKAAEWVNQALQRQPEFAEALTLRAFLERNGQQVASATQDCEKALKIDPYYALAYITLGSAYTLQGRYDDALRTLDEGVAVSPRSWQMYFEMAKASIGKGAYGKALQMMDKADRLGGYNYAEVHLVRAYALVPLKFYREARIELQAFLSREPKGRNAERAQQLLASMDKEESQGRELAQEKTK